MSDWKNFKLAQIATETDKGYKPHRGEKLRYVGLEHIESQTTNLLGSGCSTETISTKKRFESGDILFGGLRAYLRKVTQPNFAGVCSTDIMVLRANVGFDQKFLLQFLIHDAFMERVSATSHGTKMPRIKWNQLSKIEWSFPPLSEQQAIARVLSLWDAAISNLSALIEKKIHLKRALMQRLLTGEVRFGEFVCSRETRPTKYGMRPVDWADLVIGDFAFEASGRHNVNEELPVLSCTKHAGLVSSHEYFGKRIYSENLAAYKVVRRNQFAYATNHIEEGSIGLLSEPAAGLVSPMYTVFALTEQVAPVFLFALFKTELYRQIFAANTNASVDRRGSLRWKQFAQLPVSLPTLAEQQKIAAVLDVADAEILSLRTELALLKEQKRGLMQKLLVGEVRVPLQSL